MSVSSEEECQITLSTSMQIGTYAPGSPSAEKEHKLDLLVCDCTESFRFNLTHFLD